MPGDQAKDDPQEARRRAIEDLQRAVDETEQGLTAQKKRNLRRAMKREQETRAERTD